MSKTVCIVGAGPSGLVAAKSLLHDVPRGTFEVTIFDSQPRLGGLWPSRRDEDDGLIHPLMVANQSKHTVQFSDLAWPEDAPQFPQAWQVGQYLDRYYKAYCRAAELHLETRVEKTENAHSGWRVWTRSKDGALEERSFEYLLIASGYFGKPAVPGPSVIPEHPGILVIHSSHYRNIKDLLREGNAKGGKILVVGGQMSGVEIAGTIATHLSSATHSPGISPISNPEIYTVHHLIQKPVWVMPMCLSPKASSPVPSFLPLDLASYNLANRPLPLTNTQGHITGESAIRTSSLYETALGTNQSIYSPTLAITHKDNANPQFLAVSDNYAEFVRSGLITVSQGKLEKLSDHEATISPTQDKIDDIAAVVLATGFKASHSISFLPPDVLELLSLSPEDLDNTVALGFHGTYHPHVPNLGFVGFYRSPYWGVMEMQARFVTKLWNSGGSMSGTLVPKSLSQALKNDTSITRTLALREDPRASQFPMGDYAWLMQEFASALDLERVDHLSTMPALPPADNEMNILTPARYPSERLNEFQQSEVTKSLKQTEATVWAGVSSGKFVAKAVFRSLLGEWKLERELVSKLSSHPSGHFSGTAKFLLREGTRDGREAEFDIIVEEGGDVGMEYLYIEEGDFKANNGFTFRATRRYIWRYNEKKDELSVWFAKTDDQKRADYLFHRVEFTVPKDDKETGWKATAGHMCIKDYYDVKYDFRFKAVNLMDWNLAYTVNGPNKDYTIDGTYIR